MRLVRFWEWDFEDFIVVSVASIIVAALITLNVAVGAQVEIPNNSAPVKLEAGMVIDTPLLPGHCPICGTEGVRWYLQTTIVHEPLLVYSCPRDGNLFTEVATESE